MTERSTLTQVVQIGLETTPGTSVAANKRLTSLGIEPSPSVEIDQFKPAGQKYKSFTALGKEWITANLTGRLTYTEIVYLFASIVGNQAITTPDGATDSRNWNFSSNPFGDDVVKTFTVEHGSSARADKFTYGLVTEAGFNFSRNSCEITGSMMGKAITDGITMTSSPTVVDLLPVLPTHCSIYLDDEVGDLGTTKLTRVLTCGWSLGSRFSPVWPIDAGLDPPTSFAAIIESEPDLSVNMTMEANAEGMAVLTQLQEGERKYLRIEAVGGEIEDGFNYTLTIDTAVEVVDGGNFSDQDGVYSVDWQFVGVVDGAWGSGKAFDINVQNKQTAL